MFLLREVDEKLLFREFIMKNSLLFSMASLIGIVCLELERAWRNIRNFAFNNRTIFEILFIILYSLSQILLILFVELYPQKISFTLSVFAILVLSVFALHKLLMESRIKVLEGQVTDLQKEKQQIIFRSEKLLNKYVLITQFFQSKSKDLNKMKVTKRR